MSGKLDYLLLTVWAVGLALGAAFWWAVVLAVRSVM